MFSGCEASGRHGQVGCLDTSLLPPQYSLDLPGVGGGLVQGDSLWSHQVGGRRSLVSSSEVVPVDSMGPSACQTISSQAVLWLVFCIVLVLITKKQNPVCASPGQSWGSQ